MPIAYSFAVRDYGFSPHGGDSAPSHDVIRVSETGDSHRTERELIQGG